MASISGGSSSKPPSAPYWKGKGRATEHDFDDLNPTITYRHLLSSNLGQVRLGIDPALPLVVQQWEALIAVNYPARKYGISRMDKARDAKKRCPHLVVVHVATYKEGEPEPGYWENPDTRTHKVSLDHYRRESMKIIQMFKEGLPDGEVGECLLSHFFEALRVGRGQGQEELLWPDVLLGSEKASIDEAFIDFTRPVREEMLRRYPHLASVPADAPNGLDTPLPPPPPISWKGKGTIVPVVPPKEEQKKEDVKSPDGESSVEDESSAAEVASNASEPDGEVEEDAVAEDDEETSWHDVALSIAGELMMRIREDIRTKLGYTTSAGLARNKFLAKTILRNAAIPNYLKPMPFQKIRFLGGKLGKALAEEYDVSTVSDLLGNAKEVRGTLRLGLRDLSGLTAPKVRSLALIATPTPAMQHLTSFHYYRRTIRVVKEKSAVNKSMLASKNLPKPITKATEGQHWLRVLAAELALRLNEARDADPALWPKTIVLHIRQGYETARSKQLPFPFARSVTTDVIASFGNKLWKELVGTAGSTPFKITSVQLSFSGIESMEAGQRRIEGFFAARGASDDHNASESDVVPSASDSNGKPPSKRPRSSSINHNSPETASGKRQNTGELEDQNMKSDLSARVRDERHSFLCEKCHERIWLADAPAISRVEGDAGGSGAGETADDAIREDALAALRLEHADFHFAEELAAAGDERAPKRVIRPADRPTSSSTVTAKKRQKKAANHGIAQFFSRKQ
uniref:DNA polymerase eta n=1 Tax=Ganoderma boninense TaxID=34458 RepID=A0A5K1K4N3_9APHY|nr:3-isopropylmalate dehydrogenase (3-IPM-DH) (IMDH) (EC (Beta-IPM dehydrogenase) [Ganoderma boninense]